jgi:two-component system response regulator ChvI
MLRSDNSALRARIGLTRPAFGAISDSWRQRNRLLFVDDDAAYRQIVKVELEDEGFSVTDFPSGEEMLDSLENGLAADIVVLDWALGKTSGIDLLPVLRERGFDLPVVFLTGRSTPIHERLALQQGAVEFMDKTRGTDILAARLRLVAGSKRKVTSTAIRHGSLMLEPDAGQVSWKGTDIDLTVSELKLVLMIVSNQGRHVSYRHLYDGIHYEGFVAGSGEHGYRTNIRSSIKRIRRKFQDCDPTFDEIQNYIGFGYSWGRPSP